MKPWLEALCKRVREADAAHELRSLSPELAYEICNELDWDDTQLHVLVGFLAEEVDQWQDRAREVVAHVRNVCARVADELDRIPGTVMLAGMLRDVGEGHGQDIAKRYVLSQDSDCHWYVVPAEKLGDFEQWTASDSWDMPVYAIQVGGAPSLVSFTDPKVS